MNTYMLPLAMMLALILVLAAIARIVKHRRAQIAFRADRMRAWVEMLGEWSDEGVPFENLRELLMTQVLLEIEHAADAYTRREITRAFHVFLTVWNKIALNDKLEIIEGGLDERHGTEHRK